MTTDICGFVKIDFCFSKKRLTIKRNILNAWHVFKTHRGLQIKEMVFKMPYFNMRRGISRSYNVEYFWIRKLWRNDLQLAQTHSRGSWDLWSFNAHCLPWGRLSSAWDLLWSGREGCPYPWGEQGQNLRPGELGFAPVLPVLRSCFTLCGRPKTTALPSWRWFFNLLAEKAEACSFDSIWKI